MLLLENKANKSCPLICQHKHNNLLIPLWLKSDSNQINLSSIVVQNMHATMWFVFCKLYQLRQREGRAIAMWQKEKRFSVFKPCQCLIESCDLSAVGATWCGKSKHKCASACPRARAHPAWSTLGPLLSDSYTQPEDLCRVSSHSWHCILLRTWWMHPALPKVRRTHTTTHAAHRWPVCFEEGMHSPNRFSSMCCCLTDHQSVVLKIIPFTTLACPCVVVQAWLGWVVCWGLVGLLQDSIPVIAGLRVCFLSAVSQRHSHQSATPEF